MCIDPLYPIIKISQPYSDMSRLGIRVPILGKEGVWYVFALPISLFYFTSMSCMPKQITKLIIIIIIIYLVKNSKNLFN
jgi:hypothetical protein